MIIDPNEKITKIDISMRKLKLFSRPSVIAEISEFFIQCLEKLDLKKYIEEDEKEKSQPKAIEQNVAEASQPVDNKSSKIVAVTQVNVALLDSILILERREF